MKYYVVQRTDTGEYFKQTKSGYLKSWAPDDPRRKQWTQDLELATLYTFAGARSMRANALQTREKENKVEAVILRLHLVAAGIVQPGEKE